MEHHSHRMFGQPEKRQLFGIRKLKVGVASVAIATALLFSLSGNATAFADKSLTTPSTEQFTTLPTEEPSVSEQPALVSENTASPTVVETAAPEQNVSVTESPGTTEVAQQTDLSSENQATSTTELEIKVVENAASQAETSGQTETTTNAEQSVATDKLEETPRADVPTEQPIATDTMRVHFESTKEGSASDYGLWTWGGVETPSDGNKWPTDALSFSEENKDDYGYYVDVKQATGHAEIGYLLLKNDKKVVEGDQKITPMTPEANEVWVNKDFATYTYQPLADDSLVRVNYKREDNNYDGWGLWIWGDVAQAGSNWPTDALEFTNVGKYGHYVDVPLSKLLNSSIGFLLVNKNDPDAAGNKSLDMSFADRANNSQIFLHDLDATVYTNPYYIATQTGQDFSKATPGVKQVTVTASSYRAFNYNETGLIDVAVTNPDQADITRMEVDTTAIGGGVIEISPELNRVTITASSTTAAGDYDLPVRVYDADNGVYTTTVSVHINERKKQAGERDWDEQVIYFMLTDHFYNGDPSNDNPYNQDYAGAVNQAGVYKGGDFKGVTKKLDYLKNLGVTSIWVTPIVDNVPQNVSTEAGKEYYAYHGYWAEDFEKLNPHLGTLDDFHTLIDEAAAHGINIIVDVVLNHAGYGAEDKFAGMVRTADEEIPGDDQKGSLSNLPDFKTEDKAVRDQLVAWQSVWLEKSTTAKGNSIYAFRVDTVKHVDDVTWQDFKNELALKDADFHLVGESWGASYQDTKGDLGTGTMDSLLDFGFKDIARLLVNGRLKEANEQLIARNDALRSNYTLAQFLGSHDEDGFLYSIGGDTNKFKLAATALLTAKGQPVIYYGEELGQSGQNNWPVYDNRYEFDWSKTETSDLEQHYQKLLAFRNANSELLSRGNRSTIGGSDSQGWLIAKRENDTDAAYIIYNIKDAAQALRLMVSSQDAIVTDYYGGKTYTPVQDANGNWYIDLDTPALSDGGTMLLKTATGSITQAIAAPTEEDDAIAANTLRIHFKSLPTDDLASMGLWLWDDVETPSTGWPAGAMSFSEAKQDSYGYYMDVPLVDGQHKKVSFLINSTAGANLTSDISLELISQSMNEVWLDDNFTAHDYQPLQDGSIRINYYRTDGNYKDISLWLWGSADDTIVSQQGTWPDGVNFENVGKYGVYMDIPLKDTSELGFLLLDESKEGDAAKIQPENYSFKDLKNQTQIFLRDDDKTIYTNPYFVKTVRATGAQQTATDTITVTMTNLADTTEDDLRKDLQVTDSTGKAAVIDSMTLDSTSNRLTLTGNFADSPYTVTYLGDSFTAKRNWQYTDSLYDYEGELGARVSENGAHVDLTVWSPSADSVDLVVYDKADQDKVVGEVSMTKGDKGQWDVALTAQSGLGITDYRGYYYHYKITRGDKSVLVLDPYAKSLAAWNSDLVDTDDAHKVAKAAIVDSSAIGPQDLTFADINGFTAREDAIIYEVHVRDFTSDPAIADSLKNQFGTFASFVEKLDYLKDLGVTHIQLLPVMSYYFVNELANAEREDSYSSEGNNYNWGYDPQNYFALTGMYSTDPSDPARRIAEFKNLVNEIHKRGMGVILDVVYNHTAKVDLFEDLEPNYYHFMDSEGAAKTNFGGGRLGTTHHMTRRLLVDSITYLVDTYKVDGFRFDMMGEHDAAAIQAAYDAAHALNPNILMLGEGWVTYTGDDNLPEQPADQTWMNKTDSVASFSDEIRNQLKSGYPNEGQPAFITGGARDITTIFNNIKAQPGNFNADDPGDVIQYIAAHDNLTLYDIIAQSIKKDPALAENDAEIHRRLRLGNTLILTAQGTAFLHAGQEYGRTKQFKDPAYEQPVADDLVPNKSHLLTNADGTPFDYPYFIHDSYDSTDAINHFDWEKATDSAAYPQSTQSQAYTKGLIALRRSTDAFTLKTKADVDKNVTLITTPGQNGVAQSDLIIAYQTVATNGDIYAVFVNADSTARSFYLPENYRHLLGAEVVVDGQSAGTSAIANPVGVAFGADSLTIDPLTAIVLRIKQATNEPDTPAPTDAPSTPDQPEHTDKPDKPDKPNHPNKPGKPGKPTKPGKSDKPNKAAKPAKADKGRILYDAKTGVSILFARNEKSVIVSIRVSHTQTKDKRTPAVLRGKDYDLFDITPANKSGRKVSISHPARVAMPIDAGKHVAQVFYLPKNGQPQALAFTEITQVVNGQKVRFVLFTTDHFSQYGIVYKANNPARQATTVPTTTSQARAVVLPPVASRHTTCVPQHQLHSETVAHFSTTVAAPAHGLPQTGDSNRLDLVTIGTALLLGTAALVCKKKEDA